MTDPGAATGSRLKAERERRGMSSQKAADELHLDGWIVDALEADDYPRIGPSVYVKGHLKRYAALLGLPVAEIMDGYESRARTQAPTAQPSNVRLSTGAQRAGIFPWPLIASAAVLALLVVGVFWWKPWHPRESGRPAAEILAAAPGATSADGATPSSGAAASGAEPAAAPSGAPAGAPSSGAEPTAALSSAPSKAPSSGAPSAAPSGVSPALFTSAAAAPPSARAASPEQPDATAGAGRARLRLSFSADSWVDVRDAEGRRVFAGQGRANSVKTLAGVAPMRVYLGFASGVQLEINNRAVAIGRQFLAGDVARFEAGADGVLRRDSHNAPPTGVATPGLTSNARPTG
jgi:cytoskeleton protein RodZ